MAYSDFSAKDLKQSFDIHFTVADLFPQSIPIPPTNWLTITLKKGIRLGFRNEKSRSERLVYPILLELSDRNQYNFAIHSGVNLNVNKSLGLIGECDFLFSFSRIQDFLTAPIFCITEAKKQDLEQGTMQAAAQLIGATQFNEQEGNVIDTLYGCSTTGVEWRFLKYHQKEITFDERQYFMTELDELLGVLQYIVDVSKPK